MLLSVRQPTQLARWLPRAGPSGSDLGSQRHSAATTSAHEVRAICKTPKEFQKVAQGQRGTSATLGSPRQRNQSPSPPFRRRGARGEEAPQERPEGPADKSRELHSLVARKLARSWQATAPTHGTCRLPRGA